MRSVDKSINKIKDDCLYEKLLIYLSNNWIVLVNHLFFHEC